jgi:large subunit ribosomal protein L24e
MHIITCSFCGSKLHPGHGTLLVKNNCEHFYFCRSKCRKLYKLGKNPLFLKWCSYFRLSKGKTVKISEKNINLDFPNLLISETYNKLLIKFMFLLLKRTKKQNIRKNLTYLNIKKQPIK